MSTLTKLDPQRKLAKQMRQALLRNPPEARLGKDRSIVWTIVAKLRQVSRDPKLSGEQKDRQFIEGATHLQKYL